MGLFARLTYFPRRDCLDWSARIPHGLGTDLHEAAILCRFATQRELTAQKEKTMPTLTSSTLNLSLCTLVSV